MDIIGMYKNNLVSDFHDTAKFMVEMLTEEKDGWEELALRLNNLAKQADKVVEKEGIREAEIGTRDSERAKSPSIPLYERGKHYSTSLAKKGEVLRLGFGKNENGGINNGS